MSSEAFPEPQVPYLQVQMITDDDWGVLSHTE